MKKTTLLFLFLIASISSYTQTFDIFHLYFEDADGRKDTLTIDRTIEGATTDIDEELDEVNLKDKPLDALDVRFFSFKTYSTKEENHILWFCDHQNGDISAATSNGIREYLHETKYLMYPKFNCGPNNIGVPQKFFIPNNAAFPITISWDNSLIQDECHTFSFLSEIMPVRFEQQLNSSSGFEFCPERINHPLVSLVDSSTVILTIPNFQTMERLDTSLVSVYYMQIRNNPLVEPVSTADFHDQEISISPNPNDGTFQLQGGSLGDKIEIYNIYGQIVKEMTNSGSAIHIEDKGLFVVLIYTEYGIIKRQVVCH